MRKLELLVPASSLEVLKVAVIFVQMLFILEAKYLDFAQRQRIFLRKICQRELHLHMSMASGSM